MKRRLLVQVLRKFSFAGEISSLFELDENELIEVLNSNDLDSAREKVNNMNLKKEKNLSLTNKNENIPVQFYMSM